MVLSKIANMSRVPELKWLAFYNYCNGNGFTFSGRHRELYYEDASVLCGWGKLFFTARDFYEKITNNNNQFGTENKD